MPPLSETPLAKGLDAPKLTVTAMAWFLNSFEKDGLERRVGATRAVSTIL